MRQTEKANAGKAGAVMQTALKPSDLVRAERHGKREDESSQKRKVRDEEPLVYGTLDLVEARAQHMEGVKQSGKTAAIHALVQFPTDLIDGADPQRQEWMLGHAVRFLNDHHGGDAVFAARMDRDEKGRHTVDAFLLPRYDYRYKDGRTVKKASVSKFSKEHARERFFRTDKETGELILKDGKPIPRDDTRAQGSALQDRWFEYMRDEMQLEGVMPPERKKFTTKDRLEPEEYGLRKGRQKLAENARKLGQADRLARKRNREQAAENAAEAKRLAMVVAEAAPTLEVAQKIAEHQGDAKGAERLKGMQERLKRSQSGLVAPRVPKKLKPSAKKVSRAVDSAFNAIEGDER